MNHSLNYRPEIDGLRAIAVLGVVIHHLELNVLSGGFLGVDIFFVISGYLITSIILRETEKNDFSFVNFYLRRARRILPALFSVLIITTVVSWFLLYPGYLQQYGETLVSSTLFFSNIYFSFDDPYFSGVSALKPLLHTWSLSLEEQYYVVIPVLLYLFRNSSNSARNSFFLALLFASFLLACFFSKSKPSATFYLLQFRLWELLVGGVFAMGQIRIKKFSNHYIGNLLAVSGMLGIIYSLVLISEKDVHPHVITLVPTVSTALLLLFAEKTSFVGKILSTKFFVLTGIISYSLYLWHFPIISFAKIMGVKFELLHVKFLLFVSCVLLATFSYKFIELPFRKNTVSRAVFPFFTISAICFLLVVGTQYQKTGEIQRFDNRYPNYHQTIFDNKMLQLGSWKFVREKGQRFNDHSATNVLFIGDSHSKDLFNAFYHIRDFYEDVDFVRFGRNTLVDQNIRCNSFQKFSNSELFKKANVIVIDTFRNLFSKREKCLEQYVTGIKSAGKKVILAGNHIIFKNVAQSGWSTQMHRKTLVDEVLEKSRITAENIASVEMQQFELVRDKNLDISRTYASFANTHKIMFIDIAALQCDFKVKSCDVLDRYGNKIYYDAHHWTLDGAKFFGKRLQSKYPTIFDFN